MSTRNFQAGDAFGISFTVKSSTGALANADATPTATAYRNGTADGTVTVTVANPATGVYSASCTIPSGYAVGDRFSLLVNATIGGVATGEFVDHVRLVGYPNTALPNAAAGAAGGVPTSGTGNNQIHLVGGVADANQVQLLGAATPNPTAASPAGTAGIPLVDLRLVNGSAATLSSSGVDVATLGGSAAALANLVSQMGAMHVGFITNESTPTSTAFSSSSAGLTSAAAAYAGHRAVWITGPNAPGAYTVGTCSGTTTKLFNFSSALPFTPQVGNAFFLIA